MNLNKTFKSPHELFRYKTIIVSNDTGETTYKINKNNTVTEISDDGYSRKITLKEAFDTLNFQIENGYNTVEGEPADGFYHMDGGETITLRGLNIRRMF